MKRWQCKHGHLLGVIVESGAGVSQLFVLRHAVDGEAEAPAEVDVMLGPVVGNMQVRCELCGEMKPWRVSVNALIYLVESLDTGLVYQFWNRLLERAKK